MLKRFLVTLLAAALLAPVASFSASHCTMAAHQQGPQAGIAQPCDCCNDASAPAAAHCSTATPLTLRCGCSLQSQSEPRSDATPGLESASLRPAFTPALLPAAATLPRLAQRRAIDISTLQAKASSVPQRPLLCSWLI